MKSQAIMTHYQVLGQDNESLAPVIAPSPSPVKIVPSLPVRLEIPKLGINTTIESVGLDIDGKMGVPASIETVGWFNLGSKPGEQGNAVIDGHLDTITGAPAVFYNLNLLEIGDLITVTDDKNQKFVFRVTDKKIYKYDLFPVEEIFGEHLKPQLNLITCEGYFDNYIQNYTHRTVVFSELIQEW